MLRPKKFEIIPPNKKTGKTMNEPEKRCHEIEPNPSKDRAMHKGDNPTF
jgi:hypothetical protein